MGKEVQLCHDQLCRLQVEKEKLLDMPGVKQIKALLSFFFTFRCWCHNIFQQIVFHTGGVAHQTLSPCWREAEQLEVSPVHQASTPSLPERSPSHQKSELPKR